MICDFSHGCLQERRRRRGVREGKGNNNEWDGFGGVKDEVRGDEDGRYEEGGKAKGNCGKR